MVRDRGRCRVRDRVSVRDRNRRSDPNTVLYLYATQYLRLRSTKLITIAMAGPSYGGHEQ